MSDLQSERTCMAWAGTRCLACGDLNQVARSAKEALDADRNETVLILDAETARTIEIDLRGTADEVVARLATPLPGREERRAGEDDPTKTRTAGRPKLGVVAREVTLLPRHWEWLNQQPGGASVTLRKLVEEARRTGAPQARVRQARDTCYAFLQKVAGDESGYEEALRALYAGDRGRFEQVTQQWPDDLRHHAARLAAGGFVDEGPVVGDSGEVAP